MKTKEAITTVKKYYHQFLLQIHPDFFHSQLEQKTVNQDATQKLNSLVASLGTKNPKEPLKIQFYTKLGKVDYSLDPFQGKTKLQQRNVDFTIPWCLSMLEMFHANGVQVDTSLFVTKPRIQRESFGPLFKKAVASPYWKHPKNY